MHSQIPFFAFFLGCTASPLPARTAKANRNMINRAGLSVPRKEVAPAAVAPCSSKVCSARCVLKSVWLENFMRKPCKSRSAGIGGHYDITDGCGAIDNGTGSWRSVMAAPQWQRTYE